MAEPMIKLEADVAAPVLSYNVPEPVSYSGRNYIELVLPTLELPRQEDWFRNGFTSIGGAGDQGSRPGVLAPGLARDEVMEKLAKLPEVVAMHPGAYKVLTSDGNLDELPDLASW